MPQPDNERGRPRQDGPLHSTTASIPPTDAGRVAPERVAEIVGYLYARHGWKPAAPSVACPWCGADPGMPCRAVTSTRHLRRAPRLRSTPDGCHYARAGAA